MQRRRLDSVLAERGLAPSRTSAAAAVRAGLVRVGGGGERALKPGQLVTADAQLELTEPRRYVSRGGLKLENAIGALGVEVDGRDCLDVGASTGGFTDCLLAHGARRVIAADVARGQLEWRLRKDPRVHVLERVNARRLDSVLLPYRPSLATVDVSFISLAKVLAAIASCLTPDGELLALVKPQFELGRQRVGKGGVVRDPDSRRDALRAVVAESERLGLTVRGLAPSGLPGPKGNRETFVWAGRAGRGLEDTEAAIREVDA